MLFFNTKDADLACLEAKVDEPDFTNINFRRCVVVSMFYLATNNFVSSVVAHINTLSVLRQVDVGRLTPIKVEKRDECGLHSLDANHPCRRFAKHAKNAKKPSFQSCSEDTTVMWLLITIQYFYRQNVAAKLSFCFVILFQHANVVACCNTQTRRFFRFHSETKRSANQTKCKPNEVQTKKPDTP